MRFQMCCHPFFSPCLCPRTSFDVDDERSVMQGHLGFKNRPSLGEKIRKGLSKRDIEA